jgi:TNF receptor-associated factor 5
MSRSTSPTHEPMESATLTREAPRADVDFDHRGLEYTRPVDENLLCPICRCALYQATTTTCDHVFCLDCLTRAHSLSATCPVDRTPLKLPENLVKTNRIILNQLDALEVKCPMVACEKTLARSMIQNHVERYCEYAMVSCSETTCEEKVKRKFYNSGCLHWKVNCPDCGTEMMKRDLEEHRDQDCKERMKLCEKCNEEIVKCRENEHKMECQEEVTHCKWEEYGCTETMKRQYLKQHLKTLCKYAIVGQAMESMKNEMTKLRSHVQELSEKEKAKDRRIKLLESERMSLVAASSAAYGMPDLSTLSSSPLESAPYDSRDQYLLSLLESQEAKVDQLLAGMTDLEAKQTMLLFNETIPIKETIAELRSQLGVQGMHLRWLMNFRLAERRPPTGSSGATSGSNGGNRPAPGTGPTVGPMRRLSDTTRENITKL